MTLDRIDRRTFVLSLSAAGIGFAASAAAESRLDGNLVAFISDMHIDGVHPEYQRHAEQYLAKTIDALLAMNPRPAYVLSLGDLASYLGAAADYPRVKRHFDRLTAVGIRVVSTVGNHDRRRYFSAAFPEDAAASPVAGRIVRLVTTDRCDFALIDTLHEGTDESVHSPVPGTFDAAQWAWLESVLTKAVRPTFVCAHHPLKELSVGKRALADVLMSKRAFAGFIHGHVHHWSKEFIYRHYDSTDMRREMGLPSTGNWGDIGYVTLRVMPEGAVATLHQSAYWYPKPDMKPHQKAWDAITAENQGQVCRFDF